MNTQRGSLVVVGTGIQVGHVTAQARAWLEKAEKVLYCVGDSATERWIKRLNPSAESLYVFYGNGKRRIETYKQMIDRTLECVRTGQKVCMAFYGHPGIFVYPSHEAIRRARQEGYDAVMLPAVSSLDCLFANLGIDPATGCQMIEATDLLIRRRHLDTEAGVIIWQAGAVGDLAFDFKGFDGRHIPILQEVLEQKYGANFECILYEASQYPVCEPVIKHVRIGELSSAGLTGISTLYLPAKTKASVDMEMVRRLGLEHVIKDKLVSIPASSGIRDEVCQA